MTLRWGSIVLMSVLTSGCTAFYPPRDRFAPAGGDRPHPTAEQLAVLAGGTSITSQEAPANVRAWPPIGQAGTGAWVSCHVPPSWPNARVAIAVASHESWDVPRSNNWPRLIERIIEGEWEIHCTVYNGSGVLWRGRTTIHRGGT